MIIIDREKCVNCGCCIKACSRAVLFEGEKYPEIDAAKECMECYHCAAACLKKAVSFTGIQDIYPETPEDKLERLVKLRRAVRNYKKEVPERGLIEGAINTAAWAPSAKNCHSERWSVLLGYERVLGIMEMLRGLAPENDVANDMVEMLKVRKGNPITLNAPCVIISYAPVGAYDPKMDCTIATTTLELILNNMGFATCWGGYLAKVLNACPEIRHYAGVPEDMTIYCTLAVGYSDGEIYPNVAYRPKANINWV